jgi:chlorobactene glucosyltransferase
MLLWYQTALTAAMMCVLLTTLYNLRCMPRLPSGDPLPRPLPLVSILIPARNEQRNIGECLDSLTAQDYLEMEIIVLDDDSSDATADIVRERATRDSRIRLIQGQALPPLWHGKTWACHQLSQQAKGSWLLFVDADTRHRHDSVTSALAAAHAMRLDLLSLIPDMALGGFWERVIMSVVPLVFVGCAPHVLFTKTRLPMLAGAIGPFMLFRREMYKRFGGHEAVRSDIAEDMCIARHVKRAGGRIALADGVDTLRVEFYSGLEEVWNGLTKSLFAIFDYSLVRTLSLVALFGIVFLGPYGFLYQAWKAGLGDLAHFSLPLTQIILTWISLWLIDGRYLIPRRYAMTVLMAILFCLHSVGRSLFGVGTVWKGRAYQFRGH